MALDAADSEQAQQQLTENLATYEELAHLEQEFDDVDCEVSECNLLPAQHPPHPNDLSVRASYKLSAPLYKKREAIIAKIPAFWALVLEQAPQDLDQFITPSDSKLLAESLTNIEISRPEVNDPTGDPRTITIAFSFKENEHFSDAVLSKTFYFRRASDNWTGLVSQPTKISWKKGKDLTKGLTDAACALWEKRGTGKEQPAVDGAKPPQEEGTLRRKLQTLGDESTSFFTFFAFVSERRYVSAEESQEAVKAEKDRRDRRAKGEDVEDVKAAEDGYEEQDLEVCPHGAELAMTLAEEVWPHAIKYFGK